MDPISNTCTSPGASRGAIVSSSTVAYTSAAFLPRECNKDPDTIGVSTNDSEYLFASDSDLLNRAKENSNSNQALSRYRGVLDKNTDQDRRKLSISVQNNSLTTGSVLSIKNSAKRSSISKRKSISSPRSIGVSIPNIGKELNSRSSSKNSNLSTQSTSTESSIVNIALQRQYTLNSPCLSTLFDPKRRHSHSNINNSSRTSTLLTPQSISPRDRTHTSKEGLNTTFDLISSFERFSVELNSATHSTHTDQSASLNPNIDYRMVPGLLPNTGCNTAASLFDTVPTAKRDQANGGSIQHSKLLQANHSTSQTSPLWSKVQAEMPTQQTNFPRRPHKQAYDHSSHIAPLGIFPLAPILPQIPVSIDINNSRSSVDASKNSDSTCIGEYKTDLQICTACQKKYDTSEGYLQVKVGDMIANRYSVQGFLGQGTFGTVLACRDTLDQSAGPLAIKIIRNIPKYRRAARTELQILECIHRPMTKAVSNFNSGTDGFYNYLDGSNFEYIQYEPQGSNYCIRMQFWFEHLHHICMAFPLHRSDLYNYLEKNHFQGMALHDIKAIGYQLLSAVAHMHQLHLIHTDIKPENILLKDDRSHSAHNIKSLINREILLIDFGSAIHEKQYHGELVSTRHYRAPEIILGVGWSFPCDIWSVGCVLFELYFGTQLFNTHDNPTHLAMIELIIGEFPSWMVQRSNEKFQKAAVSAPHATAPTKPFFTSQGRIHFPTSNTAAINIHAHKAIAKFAPMLHNRAHQPLASGSQYSLYSAPIGNQDTNMFFDLIRRCLALDPYMRVTAQDALEHPFFLANR